MSRFRNLPQARDGLPKYFRAAYEACRLEQLALRDLELEPQSYERELTKLIDEAISRLFSFGLVYAQKDEFAGSAPNLRAVHKFLSDLFLPGGPFHGGQPSSVFYKPNPILWAPLANLILTHPEDVCQLNKVIAWHIITCYLYCTEHQGTGGQERFECDYLLLRNKVGGAEYQHWVRDLMKRMPHYVKDHAAVSNLLDTKPGYEALHSWEVDLHELMLAGTKDMHLCNLDGVSYSKMVARYHSAMDYLLAQGSLDEDGYLKLQGSLLQAGLVSWKKNFHSATSLSAWPMALGRVCNGVNHDLSPRQWLTYLSLDALKEHHSRAIEALKGLPPDLVLDAIRTEWPDQGNASQRLNLIVKLNLQATVPKDEWLGLTGDAFCSDLGL